MKSVIGDTADGCDGINTCYQLIDRFIDKKFMPSCSWTGLSRGENEKFSIQKCKNILNVFFAIVKSVNEHFSVAKMEAFFKTVCKNAKRRNENKGLRQSSSHHRGKHPTVDLLKLSYVKKGNFNMLVTPGTLNYLIDF